MDFVQALAALYFLISVAALVAVVGFFAMLIIEGRRK